MNAETAPSLPYNGEVLQWARLWRGRSVEDVAQRLQTNPENIEAWEEGQTTPTVRQGRMLADYYDRSFLEFFLDNPPDLRDSELIPDFRLHSDAGEADNAREIWHIQRWAEEQRFNALDLFDMLGEEVPAFPAKLKATLESNPELIATNVREATDFPIRRQLELKGNDRRQLPTIIRSAFEDFGVLVLRRTDLGKLGVRGITIADTPLPTIVFGKEAATAQAFTLSHEFGHILLHQSGISGPPSAEDASTHAKAVERWCDRFAGAFLIPATIMAERWAKPNEPMERVPDETLRSLALAFNVSRHAMLIRLVDLGYVEGGYYWRTMRPRFLQEESEARTGGGRPEYYGTRYVNTQGNLYTGVVLEAWERGIITNDSAAQFMGIKNLSHLDDIREGFRA